MKKTFSILLTLALVLSFSVVVTTPAAAATLEVGPGKTYATIQAAVDAAGTGDTISVAAGTYNENVVVWKDVTVKSAVKHGAVVVGQDVGTHASWAYDVFRVTADGATVEGFDIRMYTPPGYPTMPDPWNGHDGVAVKASDVTVKDNRITQPGAPDPFTGWVPATGAAISAIGGALTGVTIEGNEIYGTTGAGVWNWDISSSVIQKNEIEGTQYTGILLIWSSGNTIADNQILNCGTQWNLDDGIRFGGNSGSNTATGNTVSGSSRDGIRNHWNNTSGNVANYNSIVGNTRYGLNNENTGVTFDASANWWGSSDPTTVAGMISGDVDFTPLLDSGTDTDPATPGFQPSLSSLTVHALGSQSGSTGRIQEGLNLVSGSTINVADGNYDGFDANKEGVTVKAASTPVISGPGISVDGQIAGILVSAHDVTIEGFIVTGNYSTGIYVYNATTPPHGATIKDNSVDQSTFDPRTLAGVTWDPAGIRAKAGSSPPTVITGNTVEFGGSGATGAQNGIDVFGFHDADYQILDNTVIINVESKYQVGINTHEISGIGGPYTSTALIKGNTITSPDNTSPCTWTKVFGIGAFGDRQGNITIEHNVVTNTTYALWVAKVETDDIVARCNDFKDSWFGVVVEDGAGAKLAIHFNNIENNCFGLYNEGGNPVVDATYNWWGDDSGPTHPGNPEGTGDAVSDNVDYDQWLGAPLRLPAVYHDTLTAGAHIVDASDEADTVVELETTGTTEVYVARYESQPFPDEAFPDAALGKYIDIHVSNPDAVVWPIYVEVHYTAGEVAAAGIEEETLGLYYYSSPDTFHRCSDTGVNTAGKFIWANITEEEAGYLAGTPFGAGGRPVPPPVGLAYPIWTVLLAGLIGGASLLLLRRRRTQS